MTFLFRLFVLVTATIIPGFAAQEKSDAREQPTHAVVIPTSELKAGMTGDVWTVFRGTEPEPFKVEITGVIQNALGPGKSMILCELTDPRVQNMGAVAGMSGSPLYIDGRFAGALSYQVQRFETVRFAGFTPAEDLLEVLAIAQTHLSDRPSSAEVMPVGLSPRSSVPTPDEEPRSISRSPFSPMSPVFTFGGLSPQVAALVSEPMFALGINTNSLGGSYSGGATDSTGDFTLGPGQAVGAALAVGDITLVGTGTVSQVDGNRVLAFGHPMLGLGTVEVPMTSAEIVAILPSNLSSFKIANAGQIIGTVRQDRLSAIYGEIGPGPDLLPVTVKTPHRTLNFSTVRHARLTPMITATGLAQAVLGSNDAGLSQGFRVTTEVEFPDGSDLTVNELYAGTEGFKAGLASLVQNLSTWLQNPVEEVFPDHVTFSVEPLDENPTMSLDNVQLSHQFAAVGTEVVVTLGLRDFQGQPFRQQISIPIAQDWLGRKLEVIIGNGTVLDTLTGRQRSFAVNQIRQFDAYLNAIRAERRTDGLYISVVALTDLFVDQTTSTPELPDSFSRIARQADAARFSEKRTREMLWETHLLPDRLVPGMIRKPLEISD
jgi:hypothetical protein